LSSDSCASKSMGDPRCWLFEVCVSWIRRDSRKAALMNAMASSREWRTRSTSSFCYNNHIDFKLEIDADTNTQMGKIPKTFDSMQRAEIDVVANSTPCLELRRRVHMIAACEAQQISWSLQSTAKNASNFDWCGVRFAPLTRYNGLRCQKRREMNGFHRNHSLTGRHAWTETRPETQKSVSCSSSLCGIPPERITGGWILFSVSLFRPLLTELSVSFFELAQVTPVFFCVLSLNWSLFSRVICVPIYRPLLTELSVSFFELAQ
jgi:hypothetical protein